MWAARRASRVRDASETRPVGRTEATSESAKIVCWKREFAHAIDGALGVIESADAETSVPADTESIRSLIQSYAGGFGTLDDTVRQYLRRWFVSQGGVQVLAHPRLPPPAGNVGPHTFATTIDSLCSDASLDIGSIFTADSGPSPDGSAPATAAR